MKGVDLSEKDFITFVRVSPDPSGRSTPSHSTGMLTLICPSTRSKVL